MTNSEKPSTITVTPSKNGNSFYTGKDYIFQHHKRNIYVCVNELNGQEYHRYETYDALMGETLSAHLWNGEGLFEYVAGHWTVIEID